MLIHPSREDLSLPHILHALGDPVRLDVVAQLAHTSDAIRCGDIHIVSRVPKSTGSHQLKVLREAGLIRMVPRGRSIFLSLRRDDLEARFPGLLDTILNNYRTTFAHDEITDSSPRSVELECSDFAGVDGTL